MATMTSRERLLKIFNGETVDRPAISLFVTDTDIEDGPPNCVIGNRTDDVIDDLIKFHEILSIDIMLRISIGVFEPIGFDLDAENWQNIWEPLKNGKFLVHRIITPEGEFKEVFNVEGEKFHGDYWDDWMKLRNVRTEALIKGAEDLRLARQLSLRAVTLCGSLGTSPMVEW